jgi:hypothetical protein
VSTATETVSGREEIAKRSGDILPVMHTAAAAIGLETLRRIQHDAADRTAEDYRFQNDMMRKVNGLNATPQQPATAPESESGMGDLIVVGEINTGGSQQGIEEALKMLKGKVMDQTTKASAQPAAEPTAEPQAAIPQASSTTNTLGKIAAGLALAGAGGIGVLGAQMAIHHLTKPEPAVVVQPADTDTDTTATIGIKHD